MGNSDQKHVLVTGGSSGIGKAIAVRYAREGHRVSLASNDQKGLESVIPGLDGEGHCIFTFDARETDDVTHLSSYLEKEMGHLDVLVNSIGLSEPCDLIESTLADWNKVMETNFYGVVNICKAIVPLVRDNGRIINISSIHANRVEKGYSSYAASKSALESFTKSMALELASRKILANCITPGFIGTPMSLKGGVNEFETEWFRDNYVKYDHLPLKRAGKPEEVAGLAYFLSTEDASYITGASFAVDGGISITF